MNLWHVRMTSVPSDENTDLPVTVYWSEVEGEDGKGTQFATIEEVKII